jgi:NADH-ubiquinone oxidoreductase chain 6
MLFLIKEIIIGGYYEILLYSLFIIAVLFGILVIISKNPIISVLFLIFLFLDISCYLIGIGLTFIGLAYLLVYIGAVSILFLFILMLINVRISDLSTDNINSIPLTVILGSFFHLIVNSVLPYMMNIDYLFPKLFNNFGKLANVTSVLWDGYLVEISHITSIGNVLYSNYSI